MTGNIRALILAGGSGTRLWPLSREEMPKQFLKVCGGSYTLLQQTVRRLLKFTCPENMRIVASGRWKPLVSYQMAGIGLDGDFVIEEPEARSTAPAIALGVARLIEDGASGDDVVLVCPSDHIIADESAFESAVSLAREAAEDGNIVTFGIKPVFPETGFGYIKTGSPDGKWLTVDSFVEKPDIESARRYVESGSYWWNGGIFCFRVSDMAQAYRDHFPEGARLFDAPPEELERIFRESPAESIDRAVMERARNIVCVPLDAGWSDVGSWDAVYENSPKDALGNASSGSVSLHGGSRSLVIGGERLICGVDLDSMIVVDTQDALFISPRGSSHKLRGIVKDLSETHRGEIAESPASARPWGTYSVLSRGERHKIKRITVSPGKRLSLQYHIHRSEHWVVVQGTALASIYGHGETVTVQEKLVHEGESVFVPKGCLHRLENPGRIPLEIIEVQIGEYVGEDDIKRVEDDYRRVGQDKCQETS
ncbi:MAG: mannose-1-phosphate guanylyltransferase/mannose-6-phosphate isomerase [Synergistaceae bacterium]|jgi:mannose-1-phosphate guanylyltransferase/mannose-6-phosphate isomerase|nr:mannose-1-phosphate guanylyltransferase/mannose-6-phosphate isomerase [Synergistaceae bacterium]